MKDGVPKCYDDVSTLKKCKLMKEFISKTTTHHLFSSDFNYQYDILGPNCNMDLYLPLNHRKSYTIFSIFVSLVKHHFLVVSTCTVFALVSYQFYYCEATVVQLMKFKT